MKRTRDILLASCLLAAPFALSACLDSGADLPDRAELVETESARLNAWFADRYDETLARSPMTQTYFGIKTAQDQLDDVSQTALDEQAGLTENWLAEMRRTFDIDRLDDPSRLSYQLFEFQAEDDLASHAMATNDYVFNHMSGPHTSLPSFLINFHSVDTAEDARAYIARLTQFDDYLGQAQSRAEAQADAGVRAPKFVYPKLASASRNVISGAPFEDSDTDSPLWMDIQAKIGKLEISEGAKETLREDAKAALLGSVQPAYISLIGFFDQQAGLATEDDGAWARPNGEAYYAARLKHYTTTDMTADEIHEIGLREVAAIQDRMREIMNRVGFEGDLKAFYDFLRTDPQFAYPNTDEGRTAYITEATRVIDEMRGQLDGLFITQPKADMVVKRVEPFREDTAFGAFYNAPAPDGSRPGTYYINLKDVADQPTYLLQALAYHEGIPGHHMQIAIAQELEGLPKFRTRGGHTAYIEGWALYSEAVPKELGLYTDPYSEFGQLSMAIFRAARLVVDTGIHAKKWDREKAVQYYLDNIPNPEADVRAEIDRYIVWPGQATAYMIGKLKIEELRAKAETELGESFDIREFHDVVLANGSVPLSVLETLVNDYIDDTKVEMK